MKICPVQAMTVVIPMLPKLTWLDLVNELPVTELGIQKRYIHLVPREVDGRQCMSAYDRETDTLFIKVD